MIKDFERTNPKITYDYIVHDVFTGGAEPIELFTQEFLTGLRDLLTPEGTIAINYAGDVLLTPAIAVFTTVMSVFSNCRYFREGPTPDPMGIEDFTNVVIFCRTSDEAFDFRTPTETDLLGSPARRDHLVPHNEITNVEDIVKAKGQIIKKGETAWLEAFQRCGAMGHWHIMRKVLPDYVWEDW